DTNDPSQVRALLDAVPPYFSQAVISPDRRTANLAFGIRLMPLDEQKRVIDDLRAGLKPPPGVTAGLAGLPVLAADANHELSSTSRRAIALLAGILAVFLVLLVIRRRLHLAAVPLIPSDIRMLRDFGIATVVDLTVSLLGVMIVLPAALMWAEQHDRFSLRNLRPRRVRRAAETSAATGG